MHKGSTDGEEQKAYRILGGNLENQELSNGFILVVEIKSIPTSIDNLVVL